MDSKGTNLRYQPGGTLTRDAFYVPRQADKELLAALRMLELCYILAPRQIGKSSLRVRTQTQLEAEGVRCATLDLTNFGTAATEEDWYASLVGELADQLKLDGERLFWTSTSNLAPVHRFERYIRQEILSRIAGSVVIFVDEIDLLRRVSIRRGDFLAVLRALYNSRATEPALRRLGICLIGVATPGELIDDPARTPFNVGRAIDLADFSRDEVEALRPGLDSIGGDELGAGWLLDAIYDWTDGHPYQTQVLCAKLAESNLDFLPHSFDEARACVKTLVKRLFPSAQADTNLSFAENRFSDKEAPVSMVQKVSLYRRLLVGETVLADRHSRLHTELRLAGLIKDVQNPEGTLILKLRNQIVAHVFDHEWLRAQSNNTNLSDALVRWKEAGRPEDLLLRGVALTDALQFSEGRESEPDAQEFLRASLDLRNREEHDKRAQAESRSRLLRRGLAGLGILSLGLVTSLIFSIRSDRAAREAEQRAKESLETAQIEKGNAEKAQERAEQEQKKAVAALQAAKDAKDKAEAALSVAEDEKRKTAIALANEQALNAELDKALSVGVYLKIVKSTLDNENLKGVRPAQRKVQALLAIVKQANEARDLEKARADSAETEKDALTSELKKCKSRSSRRKSQKEKARGEM